MDSTDFNINLVKQEPLDENFVFSQCYSMNLLYPLTLKSEPELLRDCTTIQDIFEYEAFDHAYFPPTGFKLDTDINTKKPPNRNDITNMTDVLRPLDTVPPRRKRSSDGKRAHGGSPYTSVPLPPCKVCSGIATGYHFGVITCEACKVIKVKFVY